MGVDGARWDVGAHLCVHRLPNSKRQCMIEKRLMLLAEGRMADRDAIQKEEARPLQLAAAAPKKLGSIFAYLRSPRRSVPIAVAAVFSVLVWQEWNRDPIEDVARAWNKSISRLGIRPLFPPQTDFHVGDIYAVLRLAPGSTEENLSPLQRSLIDKSFRLAHIDLAEHIRNSHISRPTYAAPAASVRPASVAATVQAGTGRQGLWTSPEHGFDAGFLVRVGGGEIPATGLMFPAISISTERSWSIAGLLSRITASGRRKADETIEIGSPATYGVDPAPAYFSLVKHCQDNMACRFDYALAMLARLYGPAVCSIANQTYIFDVDLFIVSRVFVSRAISVDAMQDATLEFERNNSSARLPEVATITPEGSPGPVPPKFNDGSPLRVSSSFRIASRQPSPYVLAFGFQGLAIRAPRVSGNGTGFPC
ncbi:MAG: Uncharacterized protein FD152_1076 [Xanthobacteraceae bacterium]|nr:MAG: Uncharacterized protein FD152_1076 [Xanthobacteraceae bacterium]